jgi:nucleoside-diphosphate-sugar epimerase
MQLKMPDKVGKVILVNGASGILGRQVVARANGVALAKATRHRDRAGTNMIHIDSDGNVKPDDLAGVDVIINCAGAVNARYDIVRQANVTHVANLAATAKAVGVGAFVQVSSFSVFGNVSEITAATRPAPQTVYGQSKFDAETLLAALGDATFRTLSVRLPFMFDKQNPALLMPLIRGFRTLPAFPLARPEVLRSMITYPDAADVLLAAASSGDSGNVNAADPSPFTFSMLARLMQGIGERPPSLFRLPTLAQKLAIALAPSAADRIFKSNLLLAEANWRDGNTMRVGLETEIIRILTK